MLIEPRVRHCAKPLWPRTTSTQSAVGARSSVAHAGAPLDRRLDAGPRHTQSAADDDAAIRAVFTAIDPARMKENSRVAEELWRPQFVDRLAIRLGELGGPAEEPDLFALATSLPCDALRPVVRKELLDHWTDGDAL